MVSNRLGDLRVRLQAVVDEYERDMRRGARATDDVEESVERLDRRTDTATGTFDRYRSGLSRIGTTAGVVTGALFAAERAVSGIARSANELVIGAGIAGVTNQEYQALSRTFRTFGLDVDFAADVINDVSERLEDARRGNETYASSFDLININLDEFASQSRVQRLFTLAQALEAVDADAAQLAANELAGDPGQRFLAVVRALGSEEIQSTFAQYRQLSFSDEQIDSIRRFNAELLLLRANLEVAGGQAARGLQDSFIGDLVTDLGEFFRFLQLGLDRPLTEEQIRLIDEYGDALTRFREARAGAGAPLQIGAGETLTITADLPDEGEAQEYGRGIAQGFIRAVTSDGPFARGGAFDAISVVTTTSPAERQQAATGFSNEAALQAAQQLNDLEEQRFNQSRRNQEELEAADLMLQQARLRRTLFWGSTIDTVLNAAVHGTEDWGAVILQVLSRIITQGFTAEGGFASLFGGGLQFGGTAFPGRSYLVGERGPEILIPNVATQVQPVGGLSVTFEINGDRRADENLQMIDQQVLPQLEQIIDGRIIAQNRRPRSGVRRSTRGAR